MAPVTRDPGHYGDYYRGAGSDPVRELERRVLGIDYGGNSYTNVAQARHMADRLTLRPPDVLLDIGTGAGWPGLYLAKLSGCRVLLTDVPTEGLRFAIERARAEEIEAMATAAAGTDLPFADECIDRIVHSDVLC